MQQIDAAKLNPEVLKTFERMTEHLKSAKVDLTATPLTSGPVLKIESTTESFIGNPAADQLLTRQYRAPFVVPSAKEI